MEAQDTRCQRQLTTRGDDFLPCNHISPQGKRNILDDDLCHTYLLPALHIDKNHTSAVCLLITRQPCHHAVECYSNIQGRYSPLNFP
jgi:hypothetical protein